MGDIIVLGVLAVIVGLIVAGMIRDKKKGKSCGCRSDERRVGKECR